MAARVVLFLVLSVVGLAGCASRHDEVALGRPAGVAENTELDARAMKPLAAWVAARMGMAELPLPRMVASRGALEVTDRRMNLARAGERMRALYTPGLIVVAPESWAADDPVELSFVVHELVHHAQTLLGVQAPCRLALEADAYRLQNAWLMEQGRPPLYDPAWIEARSACR
ncbi:MAG TPA: DUF6647 family protein [Azospirillaceae bacterium]|nr:DUF6647 family protein [Azospirillaceae bacterium]